MLTVIIDKKKRKFGFNIDKFHNICFVDTLIKGAPAEKKAKLRMGDKVITINNRKTCDMDIDEIKSLMNCSKTLELSILRD